MGPKTPMNGLKKYESAKVIFLSLPKPVVTPFETGYNKKGEKEEGGNYKWEMKIDLLEHPGLQEPGEMVWQTTAEVVRVDILNSFKSVKELNEYSPGGIWIFQTGGGTHICNYDPSEGE